MQLLFDSNIIIYFLNGALNQSGKDLLKAGFLDNGAYSTITKIEVLGFEQPQKSELMAMRLFSNLREIELTAEIVEQTIVLRKAYKIKLPDAVIASSALSGNFQLVTSNVRDFQKIPELNWIDPFLSTSSDDRGN